jgi:putative transposon-encoded protein
VIVYGITNHVFNGKGSRVRTEKKSRNDKYSAVMIAEGKVKFEVWGEEMIEKKVRLSGNSGRVYLPPDWVNHHVKIIRID